MNEEAMAAYGRAQIEQRTVEQEIGQRMNACRKIVNGIRLAKIDPAHRDEAAALRAEEETRINAIWDAYRAQWITATE